MKTTKFLFAALFLSLLAACGGGGDDADKPLPGECPVNQPTCNPVELPK